MTTRSKLAVILHADVVGSTELVRRDEQIAHERIQDAFRRFSATIVRHEGTAHEIRGDALVAEFNRASDAVSAALAFQAANGAHNQELSGEIRPEVRVGIAMGEVVIGDNTLTGVGVVLAQRIEQLAEPGALCISAAVHEALPGRLPVGFNSLGDQSLKGFADPMRVYAVSLRAGEEVPEPISDVSSGDRIEQPVMPSSGFPDKPSIAVLPFNNLSSDPEQDYFADGMAEDIITGLSKFPSMLVIARNSTFTYKGPAVDVRTVADELGVRYVLEGSIRRAGERIRVTAQLVDSHSGAHLWAERYDRLLEDIFAVQDEVTAAIVTAIAPEIDRAELARASRTPPDDLDAWGNHQRGLALAQSGNSDDIVTAIGLFDSARIADSGFADAVAMAAYVRLRYEFFIDHTGGPYAGQAKALLNDAWRLAPANPTVLVTRGRYHLQRGEFELAVADCEAAIEQNPNYALAWHELSFANSCGGDHERCLINAATAERLSPRDPRQAARDTIRACACFHLGRFEECIEWATRAVRSQDPRFWAEAVRIAALYRLGRTKEASVAVRQLLEQVPGLTVSKLPSAIGDTEFGPALIEAGIPEG